MLEIRVGPEFRYRYRRELLRPPRPLPRRRGLAQPREMARARRAVRPREPRGIHNGFARHPRAATELTKAVPGMPRAVAEYQVQRFREQLDPDRRLRDELPSVSSRAEVEKMKPLDVFTAWLEGRSLQRQVERTFERKQMSRAM